MKINPTLRPSPRQDPIFQSELFFEMSYAGIMLGTIIRRSEYSYDSHTDGVPWWCTGGGQDKNWLTPAHPS